MKRLSQSGSSNFCPELRKNALLISQSHFSNFALHVIILIITLKGHKFEMYQGSNLIMKASCVAICKNIRLGVGLTNYQTAFYFYELFICANQQDGRTRFDYG